MKKRIRLFADLLVLLAMLASACVPAGAATPTPEHVTRPGTPVYEQLVWDCNTGETLPADYSTSGPIQPDAGCDSWQINRYERPFNADTQDIFFPDLDILSGELGSDGAWFYFRMNIFDKNQKNNQLTGTYAIELDLDLDGRGDVLILAHAPGEDATQDWTTQGVQFWGDINDDVGNKFPRVPDPPNSGNGYDTLVFDSGQGDDPDLAWVRVHPGKPAVLELAFKASGIYNDPRFKWLAWTDEGVDNRAGSDYHDTFDHPVAGDPIVGQTYFPSQSINELDNTCSIIWGAPQGQDPDLCVNDPSVPPPTLQPSTTPTVDITLTPQDRTPTPTATATPCVVVGGAVLTTCTPTPTPSNTPTNTATYTATACVVVGGAVLATCTPTPTPSNTPTKTATYTATACVVAGGPVLTTCTPTPTPSKTPTNTATYTATVCVVAGGAVLTTCTPTPTPSNTPTKTATYTATACVIDGAVRTTCTPTPTPSNTSTKTATYTATLCVDPKSIAPRATCTPTSKPSNTPTKTATYTGTPCVVDGAVRTTCTPTPTPSNTPTLTPTYTATLCVNPKSTAPRTTCTPTPTMTATQCYSYAAFVANNIVATCTPTPTLTYTPTPTGCPNPISNTAARTTCTPTPPSCYGPITSGNVDDPIVTCTPTITPSSTECAVKFPFALIDCTPTPTLTPSATSTLCRPAEAIIPLPGPCTPTPTQCVAISLAALAVFPCTPTPSPTTCLVGTIIGRDRAGAPLYAYAECTPTLTPTPCNVTNAVGTVTRCTPSPQTATMMVYPDEDTNCRQGPSGNSLLLDTLFKDIGYIPVGRTPDNLYMLFQGPATNQNCWAAAFLFTIPFGSLSSMPDSVLPIILYPTATPVPTKAVTPVPQCRDRIDNDGDGLIDYKPPTSTGGSGGGDPDCVGSNDNDESK